MTASNPNRCELDLDFGSVPVGVLESAVVLVKNTGTGILTLSGVGGELDLPFSLFDQTEEPALPGDSLQLRVQFQPGNGRHRELVVHVGHQQT